MHSMQQMLESLHLAVPDHELMSKKATHQKAMLHKCCRIAALLHDIGTFPFSHAIEYAYIRHGSQAPGQAPAKKGSRKKKFLSGKTKKKPRTSPTLTSTWALLLLKIQTTRAGLPAFLTTLALMCSSYLKSLRASPTPWSAINSCTPI